MEKYTENNQQKNNTPNRHKIATDSDRQAAGGAEAQRSWVRPARASRGACWSLCSHGARVAPRLAAQVDPPCHLTTGHVDARAPMLFSGTRLSPRWLLSADPAEARRQVPAVLARVPWRRGAASDGGRVLASQEPLPPLPQARCEVTAAPAPDGSRPGVQPHAPGHRLCAFAAARRRSRNGPSGRSQTAPCSDTATDGGVAPGRTLEPARLRQRALHSCAASDNHAGHRRLLSREAWPSAV